MAEHARAYLKDLAGRIAALADAGDALDRAAEAVARAVEADGLVYVFGTGHSHMLAEEAHYRAGGLAATVPVLASAAMLHEGAVASTRFERMAGVAENILSRYPIGAKDVVIVASNSGVNAAPVEAARVAREKGAVVIAITSDAYSRAAANGRPRLAEIAHVVLDNGAPPGDAVLAVGGDGLKAGPVSTAVGAALLNAVMAEAAARLEAKGVAPPLYRSANMPNASANNERLVARYRGRNPHL